MSALPHWIRPQLTELVDAAPEGEQWLHELKYDGYRMMARLDHGAAPLLTRTGLDWTHKYPAIARAVASLGARQAYLDGELCGVGPDGLTRFSIVQLASDAGNAAALVFFLFDLLHLDGEDLTPRPLLERKERLAALLPASGSPLYWAGLPYKPGRPHHFIHGDHHYNAATSATSSCCAPNSCGGAASHAVANPERPALIGEAFRLEWLTIG